MSRIGVLLVNVGSPDSPSVRDIRRYLREFLMDPRVLDAPWVARFLIVHGRILPFQPSKSARAYRSIWLPDGSPLISISERVRRRLERRLAIPVALGMRYRHPSIETALARLTDSGVTDCLLVPLFPHYAMSSYETAVREVRRAAKRRFPDLHITVQPPFFNEAVYINALVASARDVLDQRPDHLLLSFHGVPERHIRRSDPTKSHCLRTDKCCETESPAHATCYRAQCLATARAFVQQTAVARWSVAFQSRLGRDAWLTPYTDGEIVRLAHSGVRRLAVMCPSFVSDCLETLEEMDIRGRALFRDAGGGEFLLVPSVNDHPAWIDALETMVSMHAD